MNSDADVAIKPEEWKAIYWTKVSVDTIVLAGGT